MLYNTPEIEKKLVSVTEVTKFCRGDQPALVLQAHSVQVSGGARCAGQRWKKRAVPRQRIDGGGPL